MKSISSNTFLTDPVYREHVIDVRMPAEYKSQFWESSVNVPLQDLQAGKLENIPTSAKSITLLCQSGNRAQMAADVLQSCRSDCDIVVVEGGLGALASAGATLKKGDSAVWSLERQVRVAAGALVLVGILFSFIHPYFLGLSAFVGAGLIFAGVTDYCGMALLLARMPWNK
jgi:rhodanese-related sulfurtransferase